VINQLVEKNSNETMMAIRFSVFVFLASICLCSSQATTSSPTAVGDSFNSAAIVGFHSDCHDEADIAVLENWGGDKISMLFPNYPSPYQWNEGPFPSAQRRLNQNIDHNNDYNLRRLTSRNCKAICNSAGAYLTPELIAAICNSGDNLNPCDPGNNSGNNSGRRLEHKDRLLGGDDDDELECESELDRFLDYVDGADYSFSLIDHSETLSVGCSLDNVYFLVYAN